jgi:hypothetical protein
MKRRLGLLVGGTLAAWLLVVGPARWLGGDDAALFSLTAALLCLVPSAATLVWCELALGGSPEQQLAAVMGGTAARMVFVIAAGMVLYHVVPAFGYDRFWLWIIFFYLATLALEIGLVLTRPAPADRSEKS